MTKTLCSLFKHRILRPKEFIGFDVAGRYVSTVTMKACWCYQVRHMKKRTHQLVDSSGS